MDITLDDKKYLLRLNMDAGLSFSDAAANADASESDILSIQTDSVFMSTLPVALPLSVVMHRVLDCVGEWADLETALLVEGATDDQAAFLRSDPAFLSQVYRIEASLTLGDRRKLQRLVDDNAERGVSTELRYRMNARDKVYKPRSVSLRVDDEIPMPEIVEG
jgi:hypothetical protein